MNLIGKKVVLLDTGDDVGKVIDFLLPSYIEVKTRGEYREEFGGRVVADLNLCNVGEVVVMPRSAVVEDDDGVPLSEIKGAMVIDVDSGRILGKLKEVKWDGEPVLVVKGDEELLVPMSQVVGVGDAITVRTKPVI